MGMTIKEQIKANEQLIKDIIESYKTAKSIGDIWGARSLEKNIIRLEKQNKKLLKEVKDK